ncbi:kinase-like protein [Hesseltinella vesiculosa]|uniref:Kinase-like protein n=1 Tax=Hesseltinella vesiculosa TaxID=101127 RepID=A0A1X2GX17_9FUNG|nr:kinase-like protein [Hesseltinella vesiculosa]
MNGTPAPTPSTRDTNHPSVKLPDTTPSTDSTEQDVRPEDLELLEYLGEGAAGTVNKVFHRPSGLIMAKKSIPTDADPNVQRQILRELAFMKKCQSPYVVSFYGAFLNDGEATMSLCMEYCEGGSLLDVYKRASERGGIIGEAVLERIAESVCKGLVYLHSQKLIHRGKPLTWYFSFLGLDIKPSNILITRNGQIKLCDFGVSGELINSVAATFTGTKYYMAPERIQGKRYAVQSDIWSLGLTLIEVSQNEPAFPPPDQPDLSVFELLTLIVQHPVPEMKGTHLSDACKSFVSVCLTKDPAHRPTPQRMLEHPFIKMWENCFVDIAQFAKDVWGWP